MANQNETEFRSENDGIEVFLKKCDLLEFAEAFRMEGVKKTQHITDVTSEDLSRLGLSAIQIRRFHRLWHELNQSKSELHAADNQHKLEDKSSTAAKATPTMSGLTVLRQEKKPWQDKKFGYIPNPLSEKALFLNSVIPPYYECQWKWSRNAKEFVKGFHTEGRRQYDLKKKIDALNARYLSTMDKKKPYSAGAFTAGETPLKPTDSQRIKYSISCLNDLKGKIEKLKTNMQEDDNKLFTKLGIVRSGNECAHEFQEKSLGQVIQLIRKIDISICELEEVLKKHKQMFPSAKETYTSKKRRRKENKAKSKKRKLERKTRNCSKLLQQILCTENHVDHEILSAHINGIAISKLNKKDARWLKILISEAETRFTAEATSKVKGPLKNDLLPIVFGSVFEVGSSDEYSADPVTSDDGNEESSVEDENQ